MMERPNPSEKENKLLLLYIFEQVGAMTQQQAHQLVMENELMDYLDFQLSIGELSEAGLLRAIALDDSEVLSLTSKSRETLSFFIKHVPHSRLAYIDEIAAQWREKFARERQADAGYSKTKQGDYSVRLEANEGGVKLLHITLTVPNRAQAAELCANWRTRAGETYKAMMEILLRSENKT